MDELAQHLVWWIASGLIGLGVGWLVWGLRDRGEADAALATDNARLRLELHEAHAELMRREAPARAAARPAPVGIAQENAAAARASEPARHALASAPPPPAASAAAPAPAAASVATREAAPEGVDDLKLIRGVGPAIERLLHAHGVTRFAQIARWTDAEIDAFSARLPQFRDRIRQERWVEHARELDAERDAR